MTIHINGQLCLFPAVTETISNLCDKGVLACEGAALILNDKLVPRSQWDTKIVKDGDRIEIITMAFGG